MAEHETERMEKQVRSEVLRLLCERVRNPTLRWPITGAGRTAAENAAGLMLIAAGYFDTTDRHRITLAGMDYYRKETANPVLTWLRSNWFAVIVAGCTIGVSVWGIVGG